MKYKSGPLSSLSNASNETTCINLYDYTEFDTVTAGRQLVRQLLRRKLLIDPRAWDFVTFALSVAAADHASLRRKSPDGWTREISLEIAVTEPDFWNSQAETLANALRFMTTDRWDLSFVPNGMTSPRPRRVMVPTVDAVTLLSGGLDSLVGLIDLWSDGVDALAVSQTVRGDGVKQVDFARRTCGLSHHLQLNHGVRVRGGREPSQRARSVSFIAFAIGAATAVSAYRDGAQVPVYVCENGFIGINPPLTSGRIGGLSTRTTHPIFLAALQSVLDDAGLNITLINPYIEMTKGEMLHQCSNQDILRDEAYRSTSCSRFQRYGYRHCGRCLPCQVRRASFLRWNVQDLTDYYYTDIGKNDSDHSGFDDVRAVAMALNSIQHEEFDSWVAGALGYEGMDRRSELKAMVLRGMKELAVLHKKYGVR